ncbi:MAG: hypothetical protein AB2A00_08300 [Myxococcota bacterium]
MIWDASFVLLWVLGSTLGWVPGFLVGWSVGVTLVGPICRDVVEVAGPPTTRCVPAIFSLAVASAVVTAAVGQWVALRMNGSALPFRHWMRGHAAGALSFTMLVLTLIMFGPREWNTPLMLSTVLALGVGQTLAVNAVRGMRPLVLVLSSTGYALVMPLGLLRVENHSPQWIAGWTVAAVVGLTAMSWAPVRLARLPG